MAAVDETIFSEGQDAFEHGDRQRDCPHRQEGRARRLWLAGWDEARRFADRCRSVVDALPEPRSSGAETALDDLRLAS